MCWHNWPTDSHIFGTEFYHKEHTKTIFYNLNNYQLSIDALKALQYITPNCFYILYSVSSKSKNFSHDLHTDMVKATYLSMQTLEQLNDA